MVACKRTLLASHRFVDLNNDVHKYTYTFHGTRSRAQLFDDVNVLKFSEWWIINITYWFYIKNESRPLIFRDFRDFFLRIWKAVSM